MKRKKIVNMINELLNETNYSDVVVKYGFKDSNGFHESDVDVNEDPVYECVLVKYKTQSDKWGILQSIECDSTFAIIEDIMIAINKL